MKKFTTIVITLLFLLGINFAITYFFHQKFIDYAFVVGILVSGVIWFFTSKGGVTTRYADMRTGWISRIDIKQQKHEFSPNLAFYTSLVYTIISFVSMIVHYRNYF